MSLLLTRDIIYLSSDFSIRFTLSDITFNVIEQCDKSFMNFWHVGPFAYSTHVTVCWQYIGQL